MVYRDRYRYDCKSCGRLREPDERFSARGKCQDCAIALVVDNIGQMMAHSGPNFARWRERVAASVGATLPDAD